GDRRQGEPGGDRLRAFGAGLETAPSSGEGCCSGPGAKPAREREGAGGGGARLPEPAPELGGRGGVRLPAGSVPATLPAGGGEELCTLPSYAQFSRESVCCVGHRCVCMRDTWRADSA